MNILIANNHYNNHRNNNHFNYGQTFAQYDNAYNSVFFCDYDDFDKLSPNDYIMYYLRVKNLRLSNKNRINQPRKWEMFKFLFFIYLNFSFYIKEIKH